jgi:hypothetical protein
MRVHAYILRLSLSVCEINLTSIYFWQNRKNCAPTVWHPTWQIPPPRAYLRAERERASLAHPASRAYLSGALRFLAGLFVRLAGLFLFYQVQMANSWREYIFSLVIYLSKLPNHDICQVNFNKLLEMLLQCNNNWCRPADYY